MEHEAQPRYIVRCVNCGARIGYDIDLDGDTDVCDRCETSNRRH